MSLFHKEIDSSRSTERRENEFPLPGQVRVYQTEFKAEPRLSRYEYRNSDPGRCLRCRLPRTDERTLIEHPSEILLRSWYVTRRYILAMKFLPERKSDRCLGIAKFAGRLITSFIREVMQIHKKNFFHS